MKLQKLGLVILVMSLLVPFSPDSAQAANQDISVLKQTSQAFTEVAKKAIPAVVSIQVEKTVQVRSRGYDFYDPFDDDFFERFFGTPRRRQQQPNQQRKQTGQGTGFVISKDGYILTNNHLVGKADEIKVKFKDGREFDAELIGTDEKSDVAVIKIPGDDHPIIELGDSDQAEIGQWVIAVGNPFGLSATVTVGVVSAKGRAVGIAEYEDFIQTDAAINPGNSGGPLLNIEGKAIGINTAIFSQSGGYMGIGFAIPINMAKLIKEQLVETGKVTRGYLGITMNDLTADMAKHFDMEEARGVVVTDVMKDSPAQKAGLEVDDVILKIDDKAVNKPQELKNHVGLLIPGTEVKLTILRNGKEIEKEVKIGDLAKSPYGQETSQAIEKMGMQLQEVTSELAEKFDYPKGKGLVVTGVEQNSSAAKVGIKEGMLLLSVNRQEVNSIAQLNKVVNQAIENNHNDIMLRIRSGRYAQYVILPLEK